MYAIFAMHLNSHTRFQQKLDNIFFFSRERENAIFSFHFRRCFWSCNMVKAATLNTRYHTMFERNPGTRQTIQKSSSSLFLHLSLSHNCGGRWGTTDDFTTSFLHFSLFPTALWDLASSRPVHSLMLSSHLFFCLPFVSFRLSLCLAR